MDLQQKYGRDIPVTVLIGSIRDKKRLDEVFETYHPTVVFHAAAHKHVPLMEVSPAEAVKNNVLGTKNLLVSASEIEVERFVQLSTDKAVNPTSVMGASKRIAERIVRTRNLSSATRFSVIRFGNVLGSNGSVVETFQEQIRQGGPVTVTHPDIERYFMTIPEAVHLVLFAATMGGMGETFILDMGRPVRIADLAAQMIRLSGLVPDVDVAIRFTGLRPGEKLTEELWTDHERPVPTAHPGILQAPGEEGLDANEQRQLENLLRAAADRDRDGCWRYLLRLVPTFQGRIADEAAIPPDRPVPAKVVPFPELPVGGTPAAVTARGAAVVAGTLSRAADAQGAVARRD
jgi:FlaA1/EpsC-like NDP-sugar epimerase